jgi:hypothetical protein
VVRSIESVKGAQILKPPYPGTGERHQTIVIVELTGEGTLADLTAAIEDAQTVHRAEILPGVTFTIDAKLKPDATPEAIVKALKDAKLLEVEDPPPAEG